MVANIVSVLSLICVFKFAHSVINLDNNGKITVQDFHISAEGSFFSKTGSHLSDQTTANTKECCFKCVQDNECLSVNSIALDQSRYHCELLNWAGTGFKKHLVSKVNSTFMQLQTVCLPNPCQNSGECTTKNGGTNYTCTCTNYTGRNCEINMCSPNPCQNGGRCTVKDEGTNYTCTCPVNTIGRNCEIQRWSSWSAWNCDCGEGKRTRTCQIDPCDGPSHEEKNCGREYSTVITTEGKQCAFPFKYNGVCYYNCTKVRHSRLWCSYNNPYNGQWGDCP